MKNIKERCIEFLKNKDIRQDVKEIITPIVDMIYKETYVYIWLICIYNIFLIIFTIVNLILLLRIINKNDLLVSRYGSINSFIW
tara:strand:+ start:822 stop:1073 length:252 start_codon:yes stop_codon:yes gene_type:complete